LQEADAHNAELCREIANAEREHTERCGELAARLSEAEAECKKQRETAETANKQSMNMKQILEQKRDLLKHNDQERHQLIEQVVLEKKQAQDAQAQLDEHMQRAKKAEAQVETLNLCLERAKGDAYAMAHGLLRDLGGRLTEAETEVEEMHEAFGGATRRVDVKVEKFAAHVKGVWVEMTAKVRGLEEGLAGKDGEISLARQELVKKEEELTKKEDGLRRRSEQVLEQSGKIDQLQRETEQLQHKIEQLQQDLRVEEQVGHHQEAQVC
jgi:chromosome segregation ATPase